MTYEPEGRFSDHKPSMRVDYILSISDLPRECIDDCSASGPVDEAVAYWLKELGFSVNREKAKRCLKGYGAWDDAELHRWTNDEIAERILWLACCDFSEYIVHCEDKGVDPFGERPDDFEPSSGSDIFCLE